MPRWISPQGYIAPHYRIPPGRCREIGHRRNPSGGSELPPPLGQPLIDLIEAVGPPEWLAVYDNIG